MTLRTNIIIGISFLGFAVICCARNKQAGTGKTFWSDTAHLSNDERAQRQVWVDFRKTVTSTDVHAFRQLSLPCIYCPDCNAYIANGPVDTSDTKDYVLTDQFITSGGFQSVFNKKANSFYFNEANVGWISLSDALNINLESCFGISEIAGQKVLEVSINDNSCSGEECSQTIFTFIDLGKGYKFYGMTNLP